MKRYTYTVLSSATIYKHSMVVLTAAGLAKVAANETTTTFVGIAEAAPSGVGDGSVTVTVVTDMECQIPLATALTVGDTNKTLLYCVDDASCTAENTLGPVCGIMTEFTSTNLGWVLFRQQAMAVAS